MMNHNCPICNTAGLPDYTKSEVVCHQCNSDLKAFLLLDSISTPEKVRFGIYTLIGLSFLAILFLGLFIKTNNDKKEILATNIVLNDSISNLTNEKVVLEKSKEELPIFESKEAIVKYVVKKGDYPYKIAQFFYGDGNRYKQIEADNKLEQPYTLKVGQILLIKISQD
ncbi:MAG: LysM domain-containing protein [Sphingobacteriia bacterium]